MRITGYFLWVFLTISSLVVVGGNPALAEQTNYPSLGVRGGFSTTRGRTAFYQAELFSAWSPLLWRLGTDWSVRPRLELTAGYLVNHGLDGFVGTLGPGALLEYRDFPLKLDAGVRPTVLTRNQFEGKSFGVQLQFTSHIGVEWDLGRRWILGCRFQHMSNSGLSSRNPGLNMHLFGIGYQF